MNPNLRPNRSNGTYVHGVISTPPDCARCPLRYKAARMVMPDGPVPCRIALIGEEPGKVEERKGRGFVGPSGSLLWEHLGPLIGLDRNDCWVTNASMCKAEKVRLESGAILPVDTVKELSSKCCRQRLIDELRVVDPVVIVPLGAIAIRSLMGLPSASIYAYRGSIQEVDLHAVAEQINKERAGIA